MATEPPIQPPADAPPDQAPDLAPDLAPEPLAGHATVSEGGRFLFHASAVALDGAGVLILGASGRGKSLLALGLMALGARLIADDGVWAGVSGDIIRLSRPDSAPALIEARGIGLLHAGPVCARARLNLVVDLDRAEPARLPPRRRVAIGTAMAELILAAGHPMLAPAVVQILRHGRAVP